MALTNDQTTTDVKRTLFLKVIKDNPELLALSCSDFRQLLDNIDTYLQWLKSNEDG